MQSAWPGDGFRQYSVPIGDDQYKDVHFHEFQEYFLLVKLMVVLMTVRCGDPRVLGHEQKI